MTKEKRNKGIKRAPTLEEKPLNPEEQKAIFDYAVEHGLLPDPMQGNRAMLEVLKAVPLQKMSPEQFKFFEKAAVKKLRSHDPSLIASFCKRPLSKTFLYIMNHIAYAYIWSIRNNLDVPHKLAGLYHKLKLADNALVPCEMNPAYLESDNLVYATMMTVARYELGELFDKWLINFAVPYAVKFDKNKDVQIETDTETGVKQVVQEETEIHMDIRISNGYRYFATELLKRLSAKESYSDLCDLDIDDIPEGYQYDEWTYTDSLGFSFRMWGGQRLDSLNEMDKKKDRVIPKVMRVKTIKLFKVINPNQTF